MRPSSELINVDVCALPFFLAAVCETCLAEILEEERRLQLDYTRAPIYVRQVGPGSNENQIRNIL